MHAALRKPASVLESPDAVDADTHRARLANSIAFLVLGATFATWAVRIPAVESQLSLTEGDIGIALLGLAIGSILGLATSGALVARYSARTVVRLAIAVYCLVLPIVSLAGGLPSLVVTLLGFGFGKGLLDVAANTQALRIERAYPWQIMGSFHALYSGGALLGSGLGAVITGAGVSARTHFVAVGAVALLGGLIATRWLLPGSADSGDDTGPTLALPSRELAGFCLIGFCALLIEGIANDWSAVFLESGAGASASVAALGFAAFALTMTVGRFIADRAVDAIGARRFIRLNAGMAAVGVALTLVAEPLVSLVGFGVLGFGIGGVAPVNVSLVGRLDTDRPTESAVAAVSTVSYGGFAVGPVAIGLLADATSLRLAFVPGLAVAALIAGLTYALPTSVDSAPA